MLTIKVTGLDKIRNGLGADYPRAIHSAALSIGAEVRHFMTSPLPSPPAERIIQRVHGTVRAWYKRGTGPKWTTLKGETHERKTSQKLSQSWAVASHAQSVVVGARASYAPWVQEHDKQAAVHRGRWQTDKQAIEHVVRTGIVKRELTEAIRKAFGGRT